MKRCFTDAVYDNVQQRKSADVTVEEERFFLRLSSAVESTEYMRLEEDLNRIYSELERELFSCGFIEGIRFLIGCMES